MTIDDIYENHYRDVMIYDRKTNQLTEVFGTPFDDYSEEELVQMVKLNNFEPARQAVQYLDRVIKKLETR